MTSSFKFASNKKFKNASEIENFWALSKAVRRAETAPELIDHSIVYFKADAKTSAWFEGELTALQNLNRTRYSKPSKEVKGVKQTAKIIDFSSLQARKQA